jgi:H+-translocating NAD(P) transhydrogenase subunit alpha
MLIVVFLVAGLVGYWAITKVPSLLHTPLMSGTNAISGVTVLGALVAAAAAATLSSTLLALIAIALAMVNVVGGFLVTARMLAMFREKKRRMNG